MSFKCSRPSRHFESGIRLITPVPEQGASINTLSAVSYILLITLVESITLGSMLKAPALLALFFKSSSFHCSVSIAMMTPLPSMDAANCNVLPPEPAQASITLSPGFASTKEPICCEPASCCSNLPSLKALVLNKAEFEVTSSAVGTPATDLVTTPSSERA